MRTWMIAAAACFAAACAEQADRDGLPAPDGAGDEAKAAPAAGSARVVYAMTNDADENRVIGLREGAGGFEAFGSWPTGGVGLGTVELPLLQVDDGIDPLVSEGSLARVGDSLLAVNAGDGTVTAFRVGPRGELTRAATADVGGYPNSISAFGDHVFVAVSPGPDAEGGIAHLVVTPDGDLVQRGDLLPLSVPEAHPARVLATGHQLVATELMQGLVDVWTFDGQDVREAVATPSAGPGPFGVSRLGKGEILVAEAAPDMAGAASVSSYQIGQDGALTPISAAVGDGQSATCWEAVTPDGRLAYTANTESGTISSFRVDADGRVDLLAAVAASPGFGPIDLDISRDGSVLYVLLGGAGEVASYAIAEDGRLAPLALASDVGLPRFGSQGLVAW